jgi:hypothetical protein
VMAWTDYPPASRHAAIAAAWNTWHSRHGGKLGPGPAFAEAIEAALSALSRSTLKEGE